MAFSGRTSSGAQEGGRVLEGGVRSLQIATKQGPARNRFHIGWIGPGKGDRAGFAVLGAPGADRPSARTCQDKSE